MVTDRYILVGQTPVPCEDLLEWARWMEDARDARVVRQTHVGDLAWVSTVFLGLDHGFGRGVLLFETMVFWDGGGGEMRRCSTWDEAEQQHQEMIREVLRPRTIWQNFKDYLREWIRDGRRDWQCAWRDMQGIEPSEIERLTEEMRMRIEMRGF